LICFKGLHDLPMHQMGPRGGHAAHGAGNIPEYFEGAFWEAELLMGTKATAVGGKLGGNGKERTESKGNYNQKDSQP
jgi:hypothetical protein